MSNSNEQRTQRNFVKDGDDEYAPRRPIRRMGGSPRVPHKTCECGGRLKPRGTIGVSGRTSAKCNKCGTRAYTQYYKGAGGLVECY